MSSTGPKQQQPQQKQQHQQQPALRPSSGDAGFFQETPRLGNQFQEDTALQRVLSLYLPPVLLKPLNRDLDSLASAALSPQVLHWLEDAEAHSPSVESHDAFANRSDTLRTSEGWRRLAELGAHQGVVAEGYEGRYGRIGQFAKYYIFSPSSAFTTYPFAMTDGAARLLSQHLPHPATSIQSFFSLNSSLSSRREAEVKRKVFANAHFRLISRDQSARWTSGQWMTERTGGSDVSRSETVAVYSPLAPSSQIVDSEELGPWVIEGYKFFSSATDADMTILLAKTSGAGGRLSAFFAPMRLANGERNGVRVLRLKKKLGTRALPTAELEIKGMRAWLIGEEGEGIKEISTVLNITRIHNAVSAVSFMRRGLAIAKAYSKVRIVAKNRPLWTVPLHLRTLAHLELYHRAATHLSFFTAHLLSVTESPLVPQIPTAGYVFVPTASAPQLLRLLTPLTKSLTAKLAINALSESCESLGGIGYCENEEPLNLARLLRDAHVLSIWEGTTNVLVTDLIGSLKRTSRAGGEEQGWGVFNEFVEENLGRSVISGGVSSRAGGEVEAEVLERCKVALWKEWKEFEKILETHSKEELTSGGRVVLWTLGWVLCGVLLILDARRDGDRVAVEFSRRWVLEKAGVWGGWGEYGAMDAAVEERSRADSWAVYGHDLPVAGERAKL